MTAAFITLAVAFLALSLTNAYVLVLRDRGERAERAVLHDRIQDPEGPRAERYLKTLAEVEKPPPPPDTIRERSDTEALLAELTGDFE